MAKAKKQVSFKDALWGACDKLRGTVEPAEYKHVVLSLIFLKFVNDKFEARRQELKAEGKEKNIDVQSFYTMKNVFFVPEESRWSFIMQNAKQNDIALKIDTALNTIEKQNHSLKGALPDNYYSRLGIDVSKLAALLDEINYHRQSRWLYIRPKGPVTASSKLRLRHISLIIRHHSSGQNFLGYVVPAEKVSFLQALSKIHNHDN